MNVQVEGKDIILDSKLNKADVKYYPIGEGKIRLYGVTLENGVYRRLPEKLANSVSNDVATLHTHSSGGRVRFTTDSPYVAIYAVLKQIIKNTTFPMAATAGFDLYVFEDGKQRRRGNVIPPLRIEDRYEAAIELQGKKTRDIVINFPLHSAVCELYIGLSKDAKLEASPEYTIKTPIVYYGSSITHGACASNPGACYEAVVSRNVDCDYINLGFSGGAKGELEIANYIKDLKMSAFVYDYDHNAPSAEHLENTHKRMFDVIRSANPTLPIIIMPRPKYFQTEDEIKRHKIIKKTYLDAKAAGDENVYFISSKQLTALSKDCGTVDGCHPTDLGFASIAAAVTKVMKKIFNL